MLGVSGSRQRLRLLHREALTTPHPGVWRHIAQRLFGIAADAIIVNLAEFDLTFRVDDKSTAQCEARAFGHHTKAATDGASRVAEHRVSNLADGVGRVMPCIVGEMRVR